jgi:sugar lactone lactonase YvrE
MRKQKIFTFLVGVVCVTFIQSCLKRIDRPCPSITSINPTAAGFDDTVVIKGTNFIVGSPSLYTIHIGNKTVPVIDVKDANTMRFKVPIGLGDGPVSISVSGTDCSNGNTLNFIYHIKVTDIHLFTASGFSLPAGMAIDGDGNLVVADRNNQVIKRVTIPAGGISLIAGKPGIAGTADNTDGLFVNFNNPYDVTVDAGGNIYVADYFNHCLRKISSNANHFVTTVAGVIGSMGDNDGAATTTARLTFPRAVAVNTANNTVFTVEFTKHRLRYLLNNNLTTLLGDGTTSALNSPIGVVYSEKRNAAFPIVIADRNNNRILEVNMNRAVNTPIIALPFMPQDLEVDSSGNIFVLNRTGRRIAVVYRDNTVQEIAGFGMGYDFQSLNGLAIDTKNKVLYVSDETTNSIVLVKYQ